MKNNVLRKKRLPKTLKVYKYISLIRILEWQLGKLILGSKLLTHPTVFQRQKYIQFVLKVSQLLAALKSMLTLFT